MSDQELAEATQKDVQAHQHIPVQRFTPEQIEEASLANSPALPNFAEAEAHPMPLSVEYWVPETEGESISVCIAGFGMESIMDPNTGEIKNLECVYMLAQKPDLSLSKLMTAAKVLVGNIKSLCEKGVIIEGSVITPIRITYLGQKKNRSNSKLSKRFNIQPIIIK